MGRDKAFDPPSQTKLLFSNSMGSPVANSRFSLFIAFDDNFTMGASANCFGKDRGGGGLMAFNISLIQHHNATKRGILNKMFEVYSVICTCSPTSINYI